MKEILYSFLIFSILLLSACGKETAEIQTEKKDDTAKQETIVEAEKPDEAGKDIPQVEKEKVPEPYAHALEKIKAADFKMAKKYLNLTVSDFPNSEYAYKANLIKSIISSGEVRSIISVLEDIYQGVGNFSGFNSTKDRNFIKKKIDELESQMEEFRKEKVALLDTVYMNYKKSDVSTDFGEVKVEQETPIKDIDFFKEVGYPVPKESEINEVIEYRMNYFIKSYFDSVFSNGNANYANFYFYAIFDLYTDVGKSEKDMYVNFLHEVMRLTENDKYNEKRIQVEERMAQIEKSEKSIKDKKSTK